MFLVPLLVQTAGDVTHTVAVLTTGLTQGGASSPALFRLFIDDLAGELRKAQGKEAKAEGESLHDPAKLVADDVIILASIKEELQSLLDVCTAWAERNGLEWKPEKCSVVSRSFPIDRSIQCTLAGQEIPLSTEA